MNARTTLADERRYRRALLQSQSSVVQEEQAYDSSSDEEEVPPPPPPPLDDAPPPLGTSAAAAAKEQADLAAAYTGTLHKKKTRRAPRLTPALLVHDETGLSRLLHQQPRLVTPTNAKGSISAAAAYTRRLFGHYEGAVRLWTQGHNAPDEPSAWMTAMERQSSTKVVKEHLQALRYVMRKQYVEQACGPERAERLLEQWAAAENMPLGAGADDYDDAPVNYDDADEGAVPVEQTATAVTPTARLTRGSSQAPAPISPPAAEVDDDDEVEFDMPTTVQELGPNKSKRRVLDDDSDDEDDLVLEPPAKRPALEVSAKDTTEVDNDENEEESELEFEMAEDTTPPAVEEAQEDKQQANGVKDTLSSEEEDEIAAGDETLPTKPTTTDGVDQESVPLADKESMTVAEMELSTVTEMESPSLKQGNHTNDPSVLEHAATDYTRLQVLEESTQSPRPSQPSPSQREIMDLGQPSQDYYGTQAFSTQDDSRLSFFSVDSPAAKPGNVAPDDIATPEEKLAAPDDVTTPEESVAPHEDTATQMDTESPVLEIPTQMDDNVPTQMDTLQPMADVPTQVALQNGNGVPTQMDSGDGPAVDVPTQLASQDEVDASVEEAAVEASDPATQENLIPTMEAAASSEDAMKD
jgi:hypothetical protein